MPISYEKSGVNIDVADKTKQEMASVVAVGSERVLNRVGAFAALFDGSFPELKHPILVLKTEEPGSKQKLSIPRGKIKEICYDMINHLTNDILVMGATPLCIQDAIICGKLEPEVVTPLVKYIAEAARENGSVLTGGETSEQPNVVEAGTYILTSSIVGVVDKDRIIDGSKICEGDDVIALPSNGIHTNGYSFLRMMMSQDSALEHSMVEGENDTFINVILRAHRAYYKHLHQLFDTDMICGMAHITGGGIAGNLNRILPEHLDAYIDLSKLRVLPIFSFIKRKTQAEDSELLKTFNMGVGLTVVCKPQHTPTLLQHFEKGNLHAYKLGTIKKGSKRVVWQNSLKY